MQSNLKNTIARVISNVFGPITALLTLGVIIYWKFIPNNTENLVIWCIMSLGTGIIGLTTFYICVKWKIIDNWDITNRAQRPKLLSLMVFLLICYDIAILSYGLTEAFEIITAFTIGFTVIVFGSLFYKTSLHTYNITFLVFLFISVYPTPLALLLLIIPVMVAWARIQLKRHTPWQTFIGSIVAILSVLVLLIAKNLL